MLEYTQIMLEYTGNVRIYTQGLTTRDVSKQVMLEYTGNVMLEYTGNVMLE